MASENVLIELLKVMESLSGSIRTVDFPNFSIDRVKQYNVSGEAQDLLYDGNNAAEVALLEDVGTNTLATEKGINPWNLDDLDVLNTFSSFSVKPVDNKSDRTSQPDFVAAKAKETFGTK